MYPKIPCFLRTFQSVLIPIMNTWASPVALVVKNLPANAGRVRGQGLIPEWGRFLGGQHGNPLQYFYLENPMDRGSWQAAVHGVKESDIEVTEHAHMNTYALLLLLFFFVLLFTLILIGLI